MRVTAEESRVLQRQVGREVNIALNSNSARWELESVAIMVPRPVASHSRGIGDGSNSQDSRSIIVCDRNSVAISQVFLYTRIQRSAEDGNIGADYFRLLVRVQSLFGRPFVHEGEMEGLLAMCNGGK